MKHNSNSPHVQMLMRGHGSSSQSPAQHLMRQHHFGGGISSTPPRFAEGGEPRKEKRFAKGGHCYADGGETEKDYGEKPLTGQLRKGGRAKRQHHYWGQEVIGRLPMVGGLAKGIARRVGTMDENKFGGRKYSASSPWESGLNAITTGHLRKGGRAKHRGHHFAGEGVEGMGSQPGQPQAGAPVGDNSVRQAQKKGGRSKRSHHYWGQDFFGRIPLIGGAISSIANTIDPDSIDPDQYGGYNYTADTAGRKVADIASTLGGLIPTFMAAKGGGKGASAAIPKKRRGGGVHHKHRQHHAEGGAGKVRKGMMTESGHMIHNYK